MPNRPATFRYRVYTGLMLFAVAVLVGTSVLSMRATQELEDAVDTAAHTQQVMRQINLYWGVLGDSETRNLRYVLTGRDEYLTEYRHSTVEIGTALAELERLTADNPVQTDLLRQLRALHTERLEYIAAIHQLKAMELQGRTEAGRQMNDRIAGGEGSRRLAAVRQLIDAMNVEEGRLMTVRNEQRNQMIRQNWATVLIANALALVAGIVGYYATRRMQRQAQDAFRAEMRAEQARQSSQDKSVFLASMSHEIRTPMNAIFGFTNLLAESVTDPRQASYVDSIRKSGQALLSLINDVLDLSKMEAGKLDLREEPTDLREIVDQTLTMFRQACVDKGIFLRAEYDGQAELPLIVDPVRLRQVLINLVSNAVKYTEQGGVIVRVACHPCPEDGHCDLRIEVVDSGTGIAPHQLGMIFEPFEQGDSVDGKSREGTGLGLSIARRLANLMSGDLRADSTLGEGSVFVLDIPRRMISTESVSVQPGPSARVDFDRLPPLRILVVDDVAWNRELVMAYFAGSKHRVRQANDGLAALDEIREERPDVVLMDLRMPRLSGEQALQRIRANPAYANIPVVAVTASSMNEDEHWVRARFDGYVRKPYSKSDLFEALARHFEVAPAPGDEAEAGPAPEPVAEEADTGPRAESPEAEATFRVLRKTLPILRANLRVREAGRVADEMAKLAAQLDWPALARHADALARAVDAFDVPAMQRLIDTCPSLDAHRPEPRHD